LYFLPVSFAGRVCTMSRKAKIHTKASTEAMRWADDNDDQGGVLFHEPTKSGNAFDVKMREEPDGIKAAKKIVDVLKERGMCLVEANAPQELLHSACYEAQALWDEGAFVPPFRVHDDRSMLEAQIWRHALKDEERVCWIRESKENQEQGINALRLLSKNMCDFVAGLGQYMKQDIGVDFDRIAQPMLSCYTDDRQYTMHVDNPHGDEDDVGSFPDNGMRLTCTYFINMDWDFEEGQAGGLDVYLTDPTDTPASASAAKSAPRFRVAPHGDTLCLFLSERMAHRVIATKTKDKRCFAMSVWGLNGAAMAQISRKALAMRQGVKEEDSDDE